jgi:CheY-like chemotaxis protein
LPTVPAISHGDIVLALQLGDCDLDEIEGVEGDSSERGDMMAPTSRACAIEALRCADSKADSNTASRSGDDADADFEKSRRDADAHRVHVINSDVDVDDRGDDARSRSCVDEYRGKSERSTTKEDGVVSYHVLVVDDSAMSRKMLCKILKAAGHVCEEAEDGLIALEKVKKKMSNTAIRCDNEYNTILMDFIMPNMDGPTATKEIRQLGYKGPIFGVTGNGLESDIRYFESCGADKVLIKPFRIEEFHEQMSILSNLTARLFE